MFVFAAGRQPIWRDWSDVVGAMEASSLAGKRTWRYLELRLWQRVEKCFVMLRMSGPRLPFAGGLQEPMISKTADFADAQTASSARAAAAMAPRLFALLMLSTWCGLVAGLLEVGTIMLRKRVFDQNQLYAMSRHFVWLIPVTNLVVFLALGVLGCLLSWAYPSRGRSLFTRALGALTLLPMVLVAIPRVYGLAWLVVVLGVASRVVPLLGRHAGHFRRLVVVSFPLIVVAVTLLAASIWTEDWIKQSRAAQRLLPSPASPNVLLVVMDTVTADHLSLHGYPRPTTKTLVELAERGIRFDSARSASSWTLASHATMFTGRWLHELSVGWLTPLDGTYPTLAEYLGSRGYATAGFAANNAFCARDSGLARGFTWYHDFIFPNLTFFKMAALVNRTLQGIQSIEDVLERELEFFRFRPYLKYLWWLLDTTRKGAEDVNRELVDWLAERPQPERPFFAFLNFFDAHTPYQLTTGRMHRFGAMAVDNGQRDLIQGWAELDKRILSPEEIKFAVDAYDECIADLDEQLGVLCDELERQGILDHTWLIVTADHGESFGEHEGVFCHGTSLYQTEVHVPLLIVPPGGIGTKTVVTEPVSLRDIAATIVDVLGLTAGSPIPGDSLVPLWQGRSSIPDSDRSSTDHALAELVPNDPLNRDLYGMPKLSWPLGGLADREWSYIRRESDAREELFDLRNDGKEQHNLVNDAAARPLLERMRGRLKSLTAGPLTPERFSP
jgi:arylsulfatase A-like enzyme